MFDSYLLFVTKHSPNSSEQSDGFKQCRSLVSNGSLVSISSGIKPVTFPLWDSQGNTSPSRSLSPSLTHSPSYSHTRSLLNWSQLQCIVVWLLSVISGQYGSVACLPQMLALHFSATGVSTLSLSLMMQDTHTHTHTCYTVAHKHLLGLSHTQNKSYCLISP